MRAKVFCSVWLALGIGYASAGAQASKPGMGTVTGRVICQDTQKPARFARVTVFQVPASLVLPRPPADLSDTTARAVWMNAQDAALNSGTMVVVDNARKMISKTIDIAVTSVLQTTAGKMIFGRFDDRVHAVHDRVQDRALDKTREPASATGSGT